MLPGLIFIDKVSNLVSASGRLFPATHISWGQPHQRVELNHFQLTLESAVCMCWDVQGWMACLAGGKFFKLIIWDFQTLPDLPLAVS